MRSWHARTTVAAPPADVLDVLTSPAALSRWSPVGFTVEGLTGERLESGSHARVSGRVGGRRVDFDVDVLQADPERLLLQAEGPVGMDVEYTISPTGRCSAVEASVSIRGNGGPSKSVISRALHLILAVGGLEVGLARMVREVERQGSRTRRDLPAAAARSRRSLGNGATS
jgi:uncharacterized protein YndB with AHSA1/START domain